MKRNKIAFNKEIYDFVAIKAAAEEYKSLAHVHVEETHDYYICAFTKCKHGSTRTIREFCNYIVDMMNCRQGLY